MKECNIIKDLLPLYIEELCSEDSREYVEAHLKDCKECKETFEYLKYSDLCVETVEKKEINAFKKLERYISGKILINYFLFLLVMILGVVVLLCTVPKVPEEIYYVLMPLTMFATGRTFHKVTFADTDSKSVQGRFWIQGILLLGSCLLNFYLIFAVKENNIPFGIPMDKIGPVVNTILRGSIILSLIIFISHLYQVGRKRTRYSLWCNLSILCMFMNLVYDNFLYNMFDPQTAVVYLVKNTVGLLVVYVMISLVMWMVLKGKGRDKA